MTAGAGARYLSGIAKGLSRWQPTCFLFVVIPAKAGIQEGGPRGEGMTGFSGWRVGFRSCCHARLCGHALLKPLDSPAAGSRRRSTTCIHAGVHLCRRACAGMTTKGNINNPPPAPTSIMNHTVRREVYPDAGPRRLGRCRC